MKSLILNEVAAAAKMAVLDAGDTKFIATLLLAAGKLPDPTWNTLSEPAQDWVNDSIDAINAGKSALALPDAVADEPAPSGRRRSAAPAAEAAPTYVVGDKVTVTDEAGVISEGVVKLLDDGGELVIEDAEGELGIPLNTIKSVVVAKTPEPAATGRRRTAAPAADPVEPVAPEVGDTVEIINSRDKIFVGNVTELGDELIVIKTVTGEELDFDTTKQVKSVTVKVKAALAPAAGGRRGRTAATGATAPAADEKRPRASNGSVSVGTRINECVIDSRAKGKVATEEAVGKILKDEGLQYSDATLKMVYGAALKFLQLLDDRKMLK